MRIGRIVALAAGLAGGAGVALSGASAVAAPNTVSAGLGMTGVQTADAPGGTHALYVVPGTSVRFSLGSGPSGLQAVLGWQEVVLDASSFPGGSSGVTIRKSTTKTYTFASAGTFTFTWAAYGNLNQPVTPTRGQYTSASIVVTGGGSSSGPSGSPSSSASSSASNPASRPSFGAPSDHGLAASASRLPNSSHAASSSASASSAGSSTDAGATPSASTSTSVVAGIAKSPTPSRPVGLAVVAILAFACVAGWYAYQYFGLDALRGIRRS